MRDDHRSNSNRSIEVNTNRYHQLTSNSQRNIEIEINNACINTSKRPSNFSNFGISEAEVMNKISKFWPKSYRSTEASRIEITNNTSQIDSIEHRGEQLKKEQEEIRGSFQMSEIRNYDHAAFSHGPKKPVDLNNFAERLVIAKHKDLQLLLEKK